jgi:hypothetical protein
MSIPAWAQVPVPIATGTPSFITSLTQDASYVYFGANDGTLYRVAKTGAGLQPSANIGGQIHGIAVSGGYVFLTVSDQVFFGYRKNSALEPLLSDTGRTGALIGLIGSTVHIEVQGVINCRG